MIERRPGLTLFSHAVLIAGVLVVAFPLYVTFIASTHTLDDILKVPMPLVPGDQLWENYSTALSTGTTRGVTTGPVGRMMLNSLVVALAIAIGKIAISIIASFAIVFFRFPLRNFFFWMIFVTLMLPVEVRIIPTFKVVADLGMINSYVGLTLPLIASATATFLFRQFFLTVPDELAEAARIDGAGPGRRFWTIVFPLLSPTAFFLLVVNVVYAFFETFGVIDATTQGGPAGATQILVYKVYYDGVKAADLGGSSAQSVILMAIVIALTVVQFRYVERRVQY